MTKMSARDCEYITGGLTATTKMPGPSYGLPADACPTGRQMRSVKGSVCASCYASRGRYGFEQCRTALMYRLRAIRHPMWVEAMVESIKRARSRWFRWHDSGDLQSVEHTEKVLEVCRRLPETRFWLPTMEAVILRRAISAGAPDNLTIRLSTPMLDQEPPDRGEAYKGCQTSRVVVQWETAGGMPRCPSQEQGTEGCGECRMCWDKDVPVVVYKKH